MSNVQTYVPGVGFGWMRRKKAQAKVNRGLARWIDGICHFIDDGSTTVVPVAHQAAAHSPNLDVVAVSPSKWKECFRTTQAAVAWPWMGEERFPGRHGNRY